MWEYAGIVSQHLWVSWLYNVFEFKISYTPLSMENKFTLMQNNHRCTRFENPGGGSGRFLPNFGREGI